MTVAIASLHAVFTLHYCCYDQSYALLIVEKLSRQRKCHCRDSDNKKQARCTYANLHIGSSGTVKLAKKEAPTKSAAVAKPAAAKVLARDSTMLLRDQAEIVTEGESHET